MEEDLHELVKLEEADPVEFRWIRLDLAEINDEHCKGTRCLI